MPLDAGGGPPPPAAPTPDRPGGTRSTPHAEIPSAAFAAQAAPAPRAPAAVAPTIATSDAQSGDFPRWGETMPTAGEAGLRIDQTASTQDAETAGTEMPTLELPDESIDDFIARLGREQEPAVEDEANPEPKAEPAAPAPTAKQPAGSDAFARDIDMKSAVEIAPGKGLEDLVVGEAKMPEPPA